MAEFKIITRCSNQFLKLKGTLSKLKEYKMFNYKKNTRDIRFLDPESLKTKKKRRSFQSSVARSFSRVLHVKHVPSQDVLDKSVQEHDSWIQVDTRHPASNNEGGSFLQLIRQATETTVSLEEETDQDSNFAQDDWVNASKCIGVFSDSRIYSALIQSIIKPYDLNVGHFNHPDTFKSKMYGYFDEIPCWIVFLSEEHEGDFIDRFLERYVDKPTLFLFPKMNRDTTQDSIKKFIEENGYLEEIMAIKS